jgi:pyruvate dehydrogenase E2 component (dihydrolipoamide acetyltransferase)
VKASPAARKLARDNGIDLALVAVNGPSGMAIERDVRSFMEQKQTVKASPLAVKVAAEHAVNLAEIQKEGRIMKEDVLAALSQPAIAAGEQIPLAGVPLSGMRKVIAERMSYSWQTCPHVHHTVEVDMAEAVLIKDKISKMGVKLSFTELIIKSVAKALAEFPMVNNSLINGSLVTNDSIHIGVAVALDNGLIVPVIRNANQKALSQLRAEVVDLSTRAREGKLTPDDYTGGTFTVSNLGMYGVDHFTPIVNPPESGILGVCRTVDKPVVVDGTIVIRPMMNLVLGYDHRVVDGALAGKFTARVRQLLEQPLLLI